MELSAVRSFQFHRPSGRRDAGAGPRGGSQAEATPVHRRVSTANRRGGRPLHAARRGRPAAAPGRVVHLPPGGLAQGASSGLVAGPDPEKRGAKPAERTRRCNDSESASLINAKRPHSQPPCVNNPASRLLRRTLLVPRMRRNLELEATIVENYAAVEAYLDERGRRIWAATESRAIGYGGDALVSDATGLSRPTIRKGRRELGSGGAEFGRIRRPGAGRPGIKQSQPGIKQALEKLVDPVTRSEPLRRAAAPTAKRRGAAGPDAVAGMICGVTVPAAPPVANRRREVARGQPDRASFRVLPALSGAGRDRNVPFAGEAMLRERWTAGIGTLLRRIRAFRARTHPHRHRQDQRRRPAGLARQHACPHRRVRAPWRRSHDISFADQVVLSPLPVGSRRPRPRRIASRKRRWAFPTMAATTTATSPGGTAL